MVSCDDLSLLVNAQASVRIAVVGEADIAAVLHNKAAESFDVGAACVCVDVVAVGLCVDDVCLGAEGVEDGFCNVPGASVRAVKGYFHALEAVEA